MTQVLVNLAPRIFGERDQLVCPVFFIRTKQVKMIRCIDLVFRIVGPEVRGAAALGIGPCKPAYALDSSKLFGTPYEPWSIRKTTESWSVHLRHRLVALNISRRFDGPTDSRVQDVPVKRPGDLSGYCGCVVNVSLM